MTFLLKGQNVSGRPNIILISSIALLGLIIIIIVSYAIKHKSDDSKPRPISNNNVDAKKKNGSNNNMKSNNNNSLQLNQSSDGVNSIGNRGGSEVYNIERNIYSLSDADAACRVFDGKLASLDQLIEAHKNGADWCNVGWTSDGVAAFPVQKDTWLKSQNNKSARANECGSKHGVNIVRSDPHLLYGVHCYGKKPNAVGMENIKRAYISDKERATLLKMDQFRKQKNNMMKLPYNSKKWSRHD